MTKKTKTYTPVYLMSEEDDVETDPSKSQKETLTIGSNQIFFYDDVTRQSIYTLNRQLDATAKSIQLLGINYSIPVLPPIQLFINSEGGEVFSAFSAVDRIKSSVVPVHSYVEGFCASAATLLSVCAHKRYIRQNGFMLIHQVRSGMWGTFAEFEDEIENLELIMKYIKQIYLANTQIVESDLTEILKHDTYLNAEECVKYGLVDEII
jgi:ATP-dependent Clp protease protease subunit